MNRSFASLTLLIFSALLTSCGQGFQAMNNDAGGLSTASDNFGAVQISAPAAGDQINLSVGNNLDLSVTVTTANSVQSAIWERFDTTTGAFATITGTTTSFDLSSGQTIDELTLTNAQASNSGSYRASIVVQSLDLKTTQTFYSTIVQVQVGAPTVSASGTVIPPAGQIIDAQSNKWTLVSGAVMMNGTAAGYSANVMMLLYYNGMVYQENSSGSWWSWSSGAWNTSADPRTPNPTATPIVNPSPAPGVTQIFNYSNGFAGVSGNFAISGGSQSSFSGSQMLVTNGVPGRHEAGGVWYNTQQNISSFTTDFTFQMPNTGGLINNIDGMTFCIQNSNTTTNPNDQWGSHSGLHAGTDANVSGYGAYVPLGQYGIGKSIAIKFETDSDSNDLHPFIPVGVNSSGVVEGYTSVTGLYINGGTSAGLAPQIDLNPFGIQLGRGNVVAAHVVYDGSVLTMTLQDTSTGAQGRMSWPIDIPGIVGGNMAYIGFTSGEINPNQNKVLSWSFGHGYSTKLAAPAISLASGSYGSAQSVSLSAANDATIYYTTNGKIPTTSSTKYSGGAISIASSEIIEAIAVEPGYTESDIAKANYQIGQSDLISITDFSKALNLISLNGSARSNGSQLELTDTDSAYINGACGYSCFEIASAWYPVPVTITGFTTQFTLQFPKAANANMTFTIQNQPPASYATNLPASYPPVSYSGSTPDSYIPKNFLYVSGGPNSLGTNGDGYSGLTEGDGGQVAGFYSSTAVKFNSSGTGLYENGVSVDTVGMGSINLNNSTPIGVTLSYAGTTLTMTVTQGGNSFTHSWTNVNIPNNVAGSSAYVGFTAGSGNGGYSPADQRVLNWTYSPK